MAKNNGTHVASAPSKTGKLMKIALSDIIVDESFNSRTKVNYSLAAQGDTSSQHESTQQAGTTLTELAEQIRTAGMVLSPVLVAPEGKKFFLVAGFRRVEAVRILGWTHIDANVVDMSQEERCMANLSENTARRDLKPFEIAVRVKFLREKFNTTGEAIGEQLGFSKAYVNFLTRIVDKCHPQILSAWRDGKTPNILKVDTLYKWSALSGPEQLEEWAEARGGKYDADGEKVSKEIEGDSDNAKPASKRKAPTKATIEDALVAVRKSGEKPDYVRGVTDALRFILTETDGIGNWYDPATVAERIKVKAAAEKALAKAKKLREDAAALETEASEANL